MDRKDFIKKSCVACLGIALGGTVLQSCTGTRYVKGSLNENGLLIPTREFEDSKNGPRQYVVVRHDDLQFPICVYRTENGYTALLMQCSHQGAELQVSGDQLTCPAHGSSFDKTGKPTEAPAKEPLRVFPVSIVGTQLFIDLRKQS